MQGRKAAGGQARQPQGLKNIVCGVRGAVCVHEGHRQRIKQKFMSDPDGFAQHELLELLLFYAIPRRDTNEVAHRLMDAFGSFSAVCDAPLESLANVEGIGSNAALLIKMIPHYCRRYLDDKVDDSRKIVTTEDAGSILLSKYIGRINETVILMLMDSKGKLLFCGVVNEGTVNAADIYIRKVVELAMRYNASKAILAHNHPSGVALPSRDDLRSTVAVREALALVGVRLIDHIIVADLDYVSIADSNLGDEIF